MANTLTQVLPKILSQGLMALRQQAIAPQVVNTDWGVDTAKRGDTINVPIPSAIAAADVTPNNVPPATADIAPTSVAIALSNWKEAAFELTDKQLGEVMEGLVPMQVTEAVKSLANAIAQDVYSNYKGVFSKTGTAGTTPFATDVTAATLSRKLLNQTLAPMDPRRCIIDPSAEANALALAAFNANAGTQEKGPMIEGHIGRKLGYDFFMDQLLPTHTPNALGAGALTVNGVNALAAVTVSIAKGAGANWNSLKGDIITIAGDSQSGYAITADTVITQGANTSVPISPGLQKATTGGEAVTSINTAGVINLAFHRDAFALAVRPLENVGGDNLGSMFDMAVDPVTKIPLRLEVRREYKRTRWAFDVLWGSALVRPELAARIYG